MGMGTTALDAAVAGFAAWQAYRGFSERTIERRRWTLAKWRAHLNSKPMAEATPDDVMAFLSQFPTAQTRYSMRSDLRQVYRWMVRNGHAESNPVDLVDPPRLPKRGATPIPPAEVRRAIDTATGDLRLMIMLAAMAGLRVSEIAALHADDVRPDAIVVRQGKGGKDGVVPVAPELAAELAGRTGQLFPGRNGHQVGDMIRRHLRRQGISGRPHDLRHSFATEVARATHGDLMLVQRLMRHESVQTTQRYVAWLPDGGDAVAHLYDAPPLTA